MLKSITPVGGSSRFKLAVFSLILALMAVFAFGATAHADEQSDSAELESSGGYSLARIWGNSAYDTNLATIKQDVATNGSPKGVIVCTTSSFVDALSASALSGLLDYPILLVNGTDNSMDSAALQGIKHLTNSGKSKIEIILIGGTAALKTGIENQLKAYDSNGKCERIWGNTGYDTNLAVYDFGAKRGSWNSAEVFVATGGGFQDALGASSYSAANKTFILLANPDGSNTNMVNKAAKHKKVTILGGTAAVKSGVETALKNKKLTTSRVWGNTAYDTNIEFVKYAVKNGLKIEGAGFATGENFLDALGSGHILGKSKSVLFLVHGNESYNTGVYSQLKSASGITYGRIFGGTGAVTAKTATNIKSAANS